LNPPSDLESDMPSPSEYLKHQKQALIAYVDVNIYATQEETSL